MYIYGLAQDMRFNFDVLRKNWTVEYCTDMVSPASEDTWQRLVYAFPESIYAQPARYRLAVLAIRDEKLAQAKVLLEQLIALAQREIKNTTTQPVQPPTTLRELFAEPEQQNVPGINIHALVEQAQELLELIDQNGNDPQFGAMPLAQLLRLDPNHPRYRDHLLELAIKFSGSKLHDNLLVRYALTDPDPNQRRILLERYSQYFAGQDAGAEAQYELASLLQAWSLANMDTKAYLQAKEYFLRLIRDYPRSIFSARAVINLKHLEATAGRRYE